MKHINFFAIAAGLFIILAVIITVYPGEQPRGYVNTPIGLAIISAIFSLQHEIVLARQEVSKSNIITEKLLRRKN